MVTATTGVATFQGRSGQSYSVQFYIADVVATAVKFDSGSGATSTSLPFWKCPEQVVLSDLSVISGPTVMTTLVVTADGANVPGQRLPIANYLTTIVNRARLQVGFKAGTNFGFTEA